MKTHVLPLLGLCLVISSCSTVVSHEPAIPSRALKSVTINTAAYMVPAKGLDRRSEKLVASDTMHIVAIEHFNGVQKGAWSDNGHILTLSPDNPWVKWQKAGTGMEPTGATGYFGYCGRDYYAEVNGIDDVVLYEPFPAGTHVIVPQGATLYLHTYANNFLNVPQAFHHAVRLLYWWGRPRFLPSPLAQ